MLRAINIEWETDGQAIDLPDQVTFPLEIEKEYVEYGRDDATLSDYLSDEYGWLVNGFDIKED